MLTALDAHPKCSICASGSPTPTPALTLAVALTLTLTPALTLALALTPYRRPLVRGSRSLALPLPLR